MMIAKRTGTFWGAAVLVACLAGCCGGGTTVMPTTQGPSVGQQLIDLQKAYESGAISEAEYTRLKKEAMDQSK